MPEPGRLSAERGGLHVAVGAVAAEVFGDDAEGLAGPQVDVHLGKRGGGW